MWSVAAVATSSKKEKKMLGQHLKLFMSSNSMEYFP
jgi:hypothetical protein